MNKKIILGVIIIGGCTLTSLYINNNTPEANTTTNYIDFKIDDTNTTEYVNEVKNVVYLKKKTTKKKAKKKTTKKKSTKKKKSLPKMNVKATRQQMIDYAYSRVVATWGASHWDAFYQIVSHESGWNANSVNKSSGACGLFQFVPCSKGGSAYKTNYKVQIDKGILYITYRYGTPKKAWKFWQKHHWY